MPRSRPRDLRLPAVSRFRGHAGAAAHPQFLPRRAQVRPDAGTADRSDADLQQRLAGLARRHRPRRRRFSRARRTGRQARPARRLRGAGLGPARQRLSRRLGDRAARRPQVDRRHSRQLSRAGAVVSGRAPSRSIPADKIFLVQLADAPKLDLDVLSWSRHFRCFPGQGDLPVADFMEADRGHRLCGPAVAGNLQRPVPRRLGGAHRRPTACAR